MDTPRLGDEIECELAIANAWKLDHHAWKSHPSQVDLYMQYFFACIRGKKKKKNLEPDKHIIRIYLKYMIGNFMRHFLAQEICVFVSLCIVY